MGGQGQPYQGDRRRVMEGCVASSGSSPCAFTTRACVLAAVIILNLLNRFNTFAKICELERASVVDLS